MERLGVAGLLLLCLPSAAATQRIEVAVLAGTYHPFPAQRTGITGDVCDSPPCPTHYQASRRPGDSFGALLSVQVGPRFGVDVSFHSATATESSAYFDPYVAGVISRSASDFNAAFLSVQGHVRATLKEALAFTFAAGPALTSPLGTSRSTVAFALAGAIQGRVARRGVVQIRLSQTHVLGPVRGADRNYFVAHAGLGWAVRP